MNVVTTNCSNNYGPKQHDEKLIAELKAIIDPYKESIDHYAKSNADQIDLEGEIFSEVIIEKCLKIQLITKNRWLGYRHLYRAIGISRNVKSLRITVNTLKAENFLQVREHFPPTSPKQEL
ncbi:MAG: hypothetical protein IH898_05125, partial [Planctomycetes bacterium]|nr:hypothetical protein [Planctomycetota bacterium]